MSSVFNRAWQHLRKDRSIRILSILLIAAYLLHSWINIVTDSSDRYASPIIVQITLLFLLQVSLGWVISNRFGDLFWVSRPRNKLVDERELSLRRRFFESSYLIATILAGIMALILIFHRPDFVYPHVAFMGLMFLLYVIPSLVAAWHSPSARKSPGD